MKQQRLNDLMKSAKVDVQKEPFLLQNQNQKRFQKEAYLFCYFVHCVLEVIVNVAVYLTHVRHPPDKWEDHKFPVLHKMW